MRASGGPPVALGLARSTSAFELARPLVTVDPQKVSQAVLQPGDEITARDGVVRVQLREGESILVGKGSRVSFPQSGQLRVIEGDIAAATVDRAPLVLHADTLVFEPVGTAEAGKSTAVALSYPEKGRMTLTSYDRAYSVTSDKGIQVASLGVGDTLRLVRNPLGEWKPAMAYYQGDAGAVPEAPTGDHEDADRRKGFWLFSTPVLVGAGAVAVGGLGYYAYSSSQDDSSGGGGGHDHPTRFEDSPTHPEDVPDDEDPDETDYQPTDGNE